MPIRSRRLSARPAAALAATLLALLAGLAGPERELRASGANLQQQPTFRTSVEIVAIDVNVVDSGARPVEGLKPEDFRVTVDRKPRTIVSAQYLDHGVRVVPEHGRASASFEALGDVSATPGRNVLIAIDTDSMEVGDGQAAVRAARRFMDELPVADRIGVATIPRLPGSLTFVADRAEARQALNKITTALIDMPVGEHKVGLQEAYDIERSDVGTITTVVARECRCAFGGTPPTTTSPADTQGRGRRPPEVDPTANLVPCNPTQVSVCVTPLLMLAHQLALAGHMQAQRSLDALRDLADVLRQIPGPKTVVLISGGLGVPETVRSFDPLEPALASGQVMLYTLYMERMSLGQVKRELSPSFTEDDRLNSFGIENVTAAAGGTLVRVIGSVESAFDRVATEMSGSYLLGIEVEPADRDGKSHAVEVKVNRPGAQVRARRRYMIEPEKPGVRRAEAMPPAPMSPGERAARRAERITPVVPVLEAPAPEVMALLGRAGDFVLDYEPRIAALACEEQSEQTLSKWRTGPVVINGATENRQDWFVDKRRRMRSDYVLIKGAGAIGWQHFRDPFEVDGAATRPHTGRLVRMFVDTPATAVQQAAQLMMEGARYNLGFGERNMDVPTFALVLLEPGNRARFFFRKESEEQLDGRSVWQVAYMERGTPTIFVGDRNANLPLQGTLWIDPENGRVVRSTLRLNMEEADAEITVTYAPSAVLGGLWVPAEIRETYTSDTQKLEAVSRYVNFRTITGQK